MQREISDSLSVPGGQRLCPVEIWARKVSTMYVLTNKRKSKGIQLEQQGIGAGTLTQGEHHLDPSGFKTILL